MLYAIDQRGQRILPSTDAIGTCQICGNGLIPKCGPILKHHWSHRAGDCDTWGETETVWHRWWKSRASPECCEVVIGNHRADIRRHDGCVIELQHSSISVEDIEAREAFYGDMLWLLDVHLLGRSAHFLLRSEQEIQMTWLNGDRRTLTRVRKPIYCDLGGPVLEFDGPLSQRGGRGRLLTRNEFLGRAQLLLLPERDLGAYSHTELRKTFGQYLGSIVSPRNLKDPKWMALHTDFGCEVRTIRLDGTFDAIYMEKGVPR